VFLRALAEHGVDFFFANISPEYLSRAIGGHAERVERPEELPGALARARDAVTNDGRQALVNVICPY
jgi:acetolactate synthase I/II/III large subunit